MAKNRAISIVIPAYNEEKRIGPTLRELAPVLRKRPYEIIVVADGQDDTPAAVKKSGIRNVRILPHRNRLGKGGALNSGIASAKGNVIVIYDADGAMPATELPKLLSALEHHDIAIGTRYSSESHAALTPLRKIAAWSFNRFVRLLFNLPFSDTQCGFKAFRASVAKDLSARTQQRRFVWDVEMLYLAKKEGLRVVEVPIEWEEKDGGDLAKNTLKSTWKIFRDTLKLRGQYRWN
ncbi:glycosyltransferase family 2 protein [Candidatus Micrarchaeota archaeon]|nr:glycosyltransferase family 2 protein [Candidatus Micrarchaeota archaeon]